jgi:uncharacterized membrane protein YdbT with pleckstrin-like domain
MSTFIETIVAADEYVHTIGRLSQWPLFWLHFIGLLLLPLLGLGLILWIIAYVRVTTTEFAVTDRRLVVKQGWIQRDITEISLQRIESILVHQSAVGRLLNFGTIRVMGTGRTEALLSGIAEPIVFRQALATAVDASGRRNE